MPNRRCWIEKVAVLVLFVFFCGSGVCAQRDAALQSRDQVPNESSQKPSSRISVTDMGFLPPGDLYALMRVSFATLDFIDFDHVLFTFHKTQLLPRLADRTSDDDDQAIHAVVAEVSSGKVVAQADWRMRDRSRYLWPLGKGRFLIRIRSRLYLVDRSLSLTPYLEFPGKIRSLQVSLGGNYLLVTSQENRVNLQTGELSGVQAQSSEPPSLAQTSGQLNGEAPEAPQKEYVLRIIRTDIKKQVGIARLQSLPYIPIMGKGYITATHNSGSKWQIGIRNIESGEKLPVGELDSSCAPEAHPLGEQTFMVITCVGGGDHLAVGMNMEGKHLWTHTWSGKRVWPFSVVSADGKRFLYETMVMDHTVSAMTAMSSEGVMGQLVEAYDSETGRLRLVAPTNPILDAGQNFAITEDGRRVAVLHDNAIEVFDLPSADANAAK